MKEKDDTDLYQAQNGAIGLREDLLVETMWANLDQTAALFGRDKSVISRHLSYIFLRMNWNEIELLHFLQQFRMKVEEWGPVR